MSEEASSTGDGSSDPCRSRGSGEEWSESGYSWKVEPIGLPDRMWGVKKGVGGDSMVFDLND